MLIMHPAEHPASEVLKIKAFFIYITNIFLGQMKSASKPGTAKFIK